jgi:hypothetical protein
MPNRTRRVATAALAALSFSLTASAETKSVGTPEVTLYLPGGTRGHVIFGKSPFLDVQQSSSAIIVSAKLDCVTKRNEHTSCIRTGVAVRDKHIWKYLESDKFPEATLSVERAQLKVPNESEKVESDATGTFSMHGVTRVLGFHYVAKRAGGNIRIRAAINVNLRDFNLAQPTFYGVHTGTLAEINVWFNLAASPSNPIGLPVGAN